MERGTRRPVRPPDAARRLVPLLLALLLAGLAAGSHLEPHLRPNLVFGQSAPLSGQVKQLGIDVRRGIEASFALTGREGGAAPFGNLTLVSLDDNYTPEIAVANTRRLLDEGAFALIGYVGTAPAAAALPVAAAAGVPFFAPVTGARSVGRDPAVENAVHIRAGYDDEGEAVARYSLDYLHAARISVLYQDDGFGEAVLQSMRAALARRGLAVIRAASFPRNTDKVEEAVLALAADLPQAVVIGAPYRAAAVAIRMYGELNSTAPVTEPWFFAFSFVHPDSLLAEMAAEGIRTFDRLHCTTVVPDYWEESSPLVRRYAGAVRAAFGPSAALSLASFEGFIAGQLLAQALRRVPAEAALAGGAAARAALLDAVYRPLGFDGSGTFQLEDLSLGPFCRSRHASWPACRNVGRSLVSVIRLGDAVMRDTGYVPLPADAADGADPRRCFFVLGISANLRGAGWHLERGVRAFFARMNEEKPATAGRRVYVVALDDGDDPAAAAANAARLLQEFKAVALLGPTSDATRDVLHRAAARANVPLLLPFTGPPGFQLASPPNRTLVHVRASEDDEAWAMLQRLQREAAKGAAALIEEGAWGRARLFGLRLAGLASGWALPAVVWYPASTAPAAAAALAAAAAGPRGAVLVFARGERARSALAALASLDPPPALLLSGSFAGEPEAVARLPPASPARLALSLPVPFANGSTPLARRFQADVAGCDDPGGMPAGTLSQAALEGFMTAWMLHMALEGGEGDDFWERLVPRIYSTALFDLAGTVLGPYRDPAAAGDDACTQGMRAVHMAEAELSGPSRGLLREAVPPAGVSFEACGALRHFRPPVCPAGKALDPAAGCQGCPPGTYSEKGVGGCLPCPAGTSADSPGSARCVPCARGSAAPREGSVACEICAPGTFASERGQATCTPCRPGTYQDRPAALQCLACGPTEYGEREGLPECARCPANAVAVARAPGAKSIAAPCACLPGYFSMEPLVAGTNQSCVPCPDGGYCPGAPTLGDAESLRPLSGYWRMPRLPGAALPNLKFMRCPVADACGGCPADAGHSSCGNGTCRYEACNPEGCRPGFDGFLCGTCMPGWYSDVRRVCRQCPDRGTTEYAGAVLTFIALCFLVLALPKLAKRPTSQFSTTGKILVTFLQLNSFVSDVPGGLTPSVKAFFDFQSFALWGGIDVGFHQWQCFVGDVDALEALFGVLLVPCAFVALSGLVHFCLYLHRLRRLSRLASSRDEAELAEAAGRARDGRPPGPPPKEPSRVLSLFRRLSRVAARQAGPEEAAAEESPPQGRPNGQTFECGCGECGDAAPERVARCLALRQIRAEIVIIIFLCYPTISRRVLETFHCRVYGDRATGQTAHVLSSDFSISCTTLRYQLMRALVAAPAFLFFCLGVPATFVFSLWRRLRALTYEVDQKRRDARRAALRDRYGFVLGSYRLRCFFYEGVVMTRKLLLVGIFVFTAEMPLHQTGTATALSILALIMAAWMRPYRAPLENALELWACLAVAVTYLATMASVGLNVRATAASAPGSALLLSAPGGEEIEQAAATREALSLLALVLNALVAAALLLHMLVDLNARGRHWLAAASRRVRVAAALALERQPSPELLIGLRHRLGALPTQIELTDPAVHEPKGARAGGGGKGRAAAPEELRLVEPARRPAPPPPPPAGPDWLREAARRCRRAAQVAWVFLVALWDPERGLPPAARRGSLNPTASELRALGVAAPAPPSPPSNGAAGSMDAEAAQGGAEALSAAVVDRDAPRGDAEAGGAGAAEEKRPGERARGNRRDLPPGARSRSETRRRQWEVASYGTDGRFASVAQPRPADLPAMMNHLRTLSELFQLTHAWGFADEDCLAAVLGADPAAVRAELDVLGAAGLTTQDGMNVFLSHRGRIVALDLVRHQRVMQLWLADRPKEDARLSGAIQREIREWRDAYCLSDCLDMEERVEELFAARPDFTLTPGAVPFSSGARPPLARLSEPPPPAPSEEAAAAATPSAPASPRLAAEGGSSGGRSAAQSPASSRGRSRLTPLNVAPLGPPLRTGHGPREAHRHGPDEALRATLARQHQPRRRSRDDGQPTARSPPGGGGAPLAALRLVPPPAETAFYTSPVAFGKCPPPARSGLPPRPGQPSAATCPAPLRRFERPPPALSPPRSAALAPPRPPSGASGGAPAPPTPPQAARSPPPRGPPPPLALPPQAPPEDSGAGTTPPNPTPPGTFRPVAEHGPAA